MKILSKKIIKGVGFIKVIPEEDDDFCHKRGEIVKNLIGYHWVNFIHMKLNQNIDSNLQRKLGQISLCNIRLNKTIGNIIRSSIYNGRRSRSFMFDWISNNKIEIKGRKTNIKKRNQNEQREKAMEEFFRASLVALEQDQSFEQIKCLIVASPGFKIIDLLRMISIYF
ncbi:unnamed protein product [Paramecium sonneborni]|uniref:Uncharacterized protein n=1 Tax=Paramecium sonneborni TaxID=65129 RepID=A0A8S1N2K5_9CILI|nr:unnamed protein product [Paramecium sonneborni]